jgi:hypothetical protein
MSTSNRDEFSESTKVMLALRVGYHCSNWDCDRVTSGPHSNPARAIKIGVAAHISGAAPGSARYDHTLSSEHRKHINNGIWLCQSCGRLIDTDETKYSLELLQQWKSKAETKALLEIENPTLPNQNKVAEVLGRVEQIAANEFGNIGDRLGKIEDLIKGFIGSSESSKPESSQESGSEMLGYMILGLSDKEFITWFDLFSDDPQSIIADRYEDVYFRDFREMQGTIKAVNIVLGKTEALTRQGVDRDKAYEKALFEVSITRARLYLAKSKGPKRRRSTVKVPGLKYVIYGIDKNRAREISILRTRQIVEGPVEPKRDAHEVFFKNPRTAQRIPEIIQQVVERSNGDKDAFIGWLFEAIMRLKTFGPDVEIFGGEFEFEEDDL